MKRHSKTSTRPWLIRLLIILLVIIFPLLQLGCTCLCRSGNFEAFPADIISKKALLIELSAIGKIDDSFRSEVDILKNADDGDFYALVNRNTRVSWLRRSPTRGWQMLGNPPRVINKNQHTGFLRVSNERLGIADNLTYQLRTNPTNDRLELLDETWYPHALAVSPGGRGTIIADEKGMKIIYFSMRGNGDIHSEEFYFSRNFKPIKQLIEYDGRRFMCTFEDWRPDYYSFDLPPPGSREPIADMQKVKWERVYRGGQIDPVSIDVDQARRLILVHELIRLRICDGSFFAAFLAATMNPLTHGYRYSATDNRVLVEHVFTRRMSSGYHGGEIGFFIVPSLDEQ